MVIVLTYSLTEFLGEYLCAHVATRIRPCWARMGTRFNRVCGGIFIVIGAALALRA